MTDNRYIGEELTIFSHAKNWKKYYASKIQPYFGKSLLEVGAGLGATTLALITPNQSTWLCLEPDAELLKEIDLLIKNKQLPATCITKIGFVQDLPADQSFDCIIYIDVIEHIEDDAAELNRAAKHLNPSGYLIALSPAHQALYTPFDAEIGHFRRYNRQRMIQITPPECRIEKIFYLDSVGMLLSLANRLMLRQSMPTISQIKFWDRFIIPISRIVDRLTGYHLGKTVIAIWQKN